MIDDVRPYTKSSDERIIAMMAALAEIGDRRVAGDVVECGVWKAGNIILARKLVPDRVCWLYDTFTGMTLPDGEIDQKGKGSRKQPEAWLGKMAVSVAEVRANLNRFGVLDDTKLRFVVGDVIETLPTTRPERIALLRLDTDWYASTAAELRWLYPLLSPGGILIVDDYGYWLGARRAVDDYFDRSVVIEQIDCTAVRVRKC